MRDHTTWTPDEDADAAFAERVARPLRASESLAPGFRERVMREARLLPPPRAARRPLVPAVPRRWAAAAGLALAAGVAGIVVGRTSVHAPTAPPPVAIAGAPAASADTVYLVRFVFAAPEARQVTLVGTFNGWDTEATPLHATDRPGVWTVSLPLPAGRHEYAFVVDGDRWSPDPAALRVVDDFGMESSIVSVGPVESGA